MSTTYETKTIEHLGLVAGVFDELGIGELLDQVIAQDFEQRQVTVGQAVKAMVLNGLGFANRRLYLTPHFFRNKPTERLIGEGVRAEQLNDDTLGKALDALHNAGVSEVYSLIAARAVKRLGLTPKVGHQDITSFHVDGESNSDNPPLPEAGIVHITRGYSRDSKPDLTQVALELIHEHQGCLPVAMQVLDGNQNDTQTLCRSVNTPIEQLCTVGIGTLVKDSAGYSAPALQAHEHARLKWVMRVPATLTEVKKRLEEVDPQALSPLVEGYRYAALSSEYAGVPQRWLLIHSEAAELRAGKTLTRQLMKATEAERKAFESLCRRDFVCEPDARKALEAFQKGLKVLKVHEASVTERVHYTQPGRPPKDSPSQRTRYRLQGSLAAPVAYYQERLTRASLFILATNELDNKTLSDQEILTTYKAQAIAENGFKFLKDPMFLASTLFLKKVERLMALLMVMTVCLLVYSALERRIRTTLAAHQASVPDQKGKPTQKPTTRWVFELFLDVHLLLITQETTQLLTINLKEELRTLLSLLGSPYQEAYP
ncbi:IS1634 family transposase [Nitrosococcus wardiae]|uniref:IS1634 family transposase n=1 Tax=Nitrosococcus wardiae TaxID=1814290 RepID=A0A4P7BWJ3_9GAMM|nr:IS1634 family transposase [Nitrosococcus wardiae]QBQ54443.1 IS1634 family transposase [Nitrosococcus wardiae]